MTTARRIASTLALCLSLGGAAFAQVPYRVKDIRQGTADGFPYPLAEWNGTLAFVYRVGGYRPAELWRTDGTTPGTRRLVQLEDLRELKNVNGTLFFLGQDADHGQELWKSDGTPAGTVLVKDIVPGPGSSSPSSLTNVNGTLFFPIASSGGQGAELWKSDGTAAGTVMVATVGTICDPRPGVAVGGTLYFSAWAGAGCAVWKSDGTPAGTGIVRDIVGGIPALFPADLTPVNGVLFFRTNFVDGGLWKTDGTPAGTVRVSWVYAPSNLTAVGGTLFFKGRDPDLGDELWRSDGTQAGTALVKDILPGIGSSNPRGLTNVNGTLFFAASNDGSGEELWRSDGTTEGTLLVADIAPGPESSRILFPTSAGGRLFFTARDAANHGHELWMSDGSAAGTAMVEDILPGSSSEPQELVAVGPSVFFDANDGTSGYELWTSDGTATGTHRVVDLDESTPSSQPQDLTDLNGALLFSAEDGVTGRELWASDGSTSGTAILKDVYPEGGGKVSAFGRVGDRVFFAAYSPYERALALWRSDGTPGGTVLLRDLGATSFDFLKEPTDVHGTLYFTLDWSLGLWKSDGTGAGTVRVKSLPVRRITNLDGTVFFFGDDFSPHGRGLWKSDGTDWGTVRVKELPLSSEMIAVNGRLFLFAQGPLAESGLWTSDGTEAGTVLVKRLFSTFGLTDVNGTAFFLAEDASGSRGLWKSDGTAAGTVLVKEGLSIPWFPGGLDLNGTLFFTASGGPDQGNELWKSDGTSAGTTLVKDIAPGSASSDPRDLVIGNGVVYFTATTVDAGKELWRTDGTALGTFMIADIAAGPASSSPDQLTVSGSRLFFAAQDDTTGRELWALPLPAPVPAVFVDDLVTGEGDSGVQNATLRLRLSYPAPGTVTVHYAATAGTAGAGIDFGAVAGTVSFPAGATEATILVPIVGDALDEPDETFAVDLSGPSNAVVADGHAEATIVDDDAPGLSVSDVVVRERAAPNTAVARFVVSLAPAGSGPVTVSWATADGTATAGHDYEAGAGTLTFPAGRTTRVVEVMVDPDSFVEGAETFSVNLSGAAGAPIVRPSATGRILDPPGGGDFDGDRRNDLLWRHDLSGENVLWFMNGADLVGGTFTSPAALADPRWTVAGTNDFDADGHPDILWRNRDSGEVVVWYMNGPALTSGTFLTPSALPDTRWGVVGTGDFDVDGKPDILWRNDTSGELVAWLMNGTVLRSGTFLTPAAFADLDWVAAGTGDFDGDGRTDIVWRNGLSGQNAIWFLEGTSLLRGSLTDPPVLADTRWRIVAIGDYDSDGKSDVVWRHEESGQNVLWFMNGATLVNGTFTNPSTFPDTNWKVVGPR
jgi:ELWxxDGT repeat protein